MGTTIKLMTPEGRLRWTHALTQVKINDRGQKKKSCAILIPKKANTTPMQRAWEEIAREEFAGKIPNNLRKLIGASRPILKDGDEIYATREEEKKEMYEEYQGCWVLQAEREESMPIRFFNADRSEIFDLAEIYDGCYGQLAISMSAYTAKAAPNSNYKGGPMISLELLGVCKTREGEPIASTRGSSLSDDDIASFFSGGAKVERTPDDMEDL